MNYTSKIFKYVIIESSESTIQSLKNELDNYSSLSYEGEARSYSEALNLIIDIVPTIVFFNPELERNNSSELTLPIISELFEFQRKSPIFIAIHKTDRYAFEAINKGVFAYLISPVNFIELKKTILRIENLIGHQPDSICIKSFTEFQHLPFNEILYLKADNNSTDFYLKDGSMITSFKTLKTFEKELPNIFARIHKSYIVNINQIRKIHFNKLQCTLKFTSTEIPFSKSLKSRMLEIKYFWEHGFHMDLSNQLIQI